ncbi:hypothetical protein F383_27457 [Gossypium arboreum]|uniref:Uncharacterized protein n=1 Tax=Gossypium arboreum TaxID=29729 RepID=A0A0B0PBC1_GOSAR|nr:hypothetical protein F383_27457 [Gossypium arboreum]
MAKQVRVRRHQTQVWVCWRSGTGGA